METKLKDITTEYSKFNANQVLTEKQLNAFIDYFDDQDRLSRIGLSGVGLVCGFELTPQFNADKTALNSIQITQGAGVTTDGDLVQFYDLLKENLKSKTFSYYKKFEDDKATYSKFLNAQNKQYNLWELHSVKDESYTDLVEFPEIQKMAVILYIEQYAKEDELCNKLTCDNQGIEQISNLRVLLVSNEDLEAIALNDDIYVKHDWYKINYELPVVEARRVVLTPNNTQTFTALKKQFDEVIKDESITTDLILGFDVILSKFQRPSIANKIKSLFSFSSLAVPLDFQYRYDICKDLIDTYNEIKELLLHINVNCCPNIGAFPKHLMLGKLKETIYPELRHRFYKAPIVGVEDENLQRVLHLVNRAIVIANSYIGKDKTDDVVITPSQAYTTLSEKAVPFYYNVSLPLLKNWNFDKTKNYRENQNLSYHKENLSQALPIQKPLSYNIDKNDFYRIEGHQGKMYREALAKLSKLKKDHGLSFDVKTLSINATQQNINLNDYECEFEDLKMLLNAWRAEQNCILSEVSKTFSAFRLSDPKSNTVVDKVVAVKGRDYLLDTVKDVELTPIAKEPILRVEEVISKPVSYKELADAYTINEKEYSYTSYKENIVKDSLTKEEDSLGYLIEKVFDQNKEATAGDIIVDLGKETSLIKDNEVWSKEPELGEFILTDISETLVHAYVLDNKVPLDIRDINNTVLVSYKLTIEQLCKQVKKLQAKYNSTSLKLTIKQILGLLINQLSIVCCSGKKLETLLAEIEKRKKKILDRIQLSEFVKQHPGLEHKAGVIPGGTFVMVYVTENAADKNTFDEVVLTIVFRNQPITTTDLGSIKDEILSPKEAFLGKEILYKNGGVINLWDKSASIQFSFVDRTSLDLKDRILINEDVVLVGKTLPETVSNFTTFLNRTWSRAGLSETIKAGETVLYKDGSVGMQIMIKDHLVPKDAYYLQIFNPNVLGTNARLFFDENKVITSNATLRNTVVADFSLPYMCCSDCAPINFIIPKEPPFLSLPYSHICLREDTVIEPLVFTVKPEDGVIKAVAPEGIETGVYVDPEDNKTKLEVTKIDKSLLGTTIKFTVNDESTHCEIIVYPELRLTVTIEEPIEYNNDKTEARVTYVLNWHDESLVNADFFKSIIYKWDFNGDGTKVERIPTDNKIIQNYKLPINDTDNTVYPELEISLGPCAKTVVIRPIIFDRLIPSELAIQPSYCLDVEKEPTARIKFINVNGVITVAGDEIKGLSIEGEELVIDSAVFDAYDQTIEFLEGGQTTNARISIHKVQQISIVEQSTSRYFWKSGQLYYEGFFEAGLPDGVKPTGLFYQWEANGIKSTSELFTPQFLIKEGIENTITVTLQIKDGNGCSSSTELSKKIPFPKFTISLPQAEFCLNDKTPHAIEVRPDFEGVQLTGGNAKFNEDKKVWEFIPAQSGILTPGTVTFSVVGAFASQTVTLIDKATSDFTYSFDEATRKLSLTNTSEQGEEYIWVIAGKERDPQTKRITIVEDLSNYDGEFIEVSLVVVSQCGKDVKTENISLTKIQDQTCEEITKTGITEDAKLLNREDGKLGTFLSTNVVIPTIDLYDSILKDTANSFLTGDKNNDLPTIFLPLLEDSSELLKRTSTDTERALISKYYRAQVKLFFNILHCQDAVLLEEFQPAIEEILNEIRIDIQEFREFGIKVDDGTLATFLKKYAVEIKALFISEFINKELLPNL
ncbi:hypothetical protein ACQY1Q_02695 [Tenacibaculum sp. TC6]|uniref:hypothetical protein n=1 Tax=Tenacibaculum sp. TC6 TaxID=3423223 RepID=UPI003D35A3CF